MGKKLDSSDVPGVSMLVKASAHPARLKVMALLGSGPKEFAELLNEIKLSKTALSNHVGQMVEMGIVERMGRGSYRLTEDGAHLLDAIGGFYAGSKAREEQKAERTMRQYSKPRSGGNGERVISPQPVYVPCWISYTGAISGALKALGKDRDLVDVHGYTGYAFVLNVSKGQTCLSGPTALGVWDDMTAATSVLGYRVKSWCSDKGFPETEGGPLSAYDHERAKKVFGMIKKEIDTGRPVVLWGIPIPEYGIVKGYKGDSYVVSTCRHATRQPDGTIRYDALQAPGCMHFLMFKGEVKGEPDDREAVRRAVKMAEGKWARPRYAAGPAAYEEWARVLDSGEVKEGALTYLGHTYLIECYTEGRAMAASFLERLARKHAARPQGKHLAEAAKEYGKAAEEMARLQKLFPFAFEGAFPEDKRRKGAALLRAARPHEEAGIGSMKKALAAWK
ncbi:MAG: winged helix-turn-helix transcriptional regulator [Euryarchaeota archaeon]|nr:winged helix-turn-helix transcriptional regulator [Euryarchaeota archaeon]